MSRDLSKLIVDLVERDNDEKISLFDFINQLNIYKSTTGIFIDSVACKKIIDDIESQYSPPIQLYYPENNENLFCITGNDPNLGFFKNTTLNIMLYCENGYYRCDVCCTNGVQFFVFERELQKALTKVKLSPYQCYPMRCIRELMSEEVLQFLKIANVKVIINNDGRNNLMHDILFYPIRG